MEFRHDIENNNVEEDEQTTNCHMDLAVSPAVIPVYTSHPFWVAADHSEFSLEILVGMLRTAIRGNDNLMRNRLISIIIHRTQRVNECWARRSLNDYTLQADERVTLINDLCADLHECILRALIDENRVFWEKNFQHALYFERRHVYQSFMRRESRWRDVRIKQGKRVPRGLVASFDQLMKDVGSQPYPFDIEDEQAYLMFLSIERIDLLRNVLHLPDKLKSVIFLLFWDGQSEKEAATTLGISDRTVRNRLQRALQLLRDAFIIEKGALSFE